MTEAANKITPRQLAVLHIARQIRQATEEVELYESEHDMSDLFHSQVRVFLRQTIEELRRAARHLRTTDMSEE